MQIKKISEIFSEERLLPYLKRFPNDSLKAIELYKVNIKLSEACYVSLSVLEVALRNAIHNSFSKHFKTDYWLKTHLDSSLTKQVLEAENKILSSRKQVTSGRLISELTFGFWTTLFNRKYAPVLWKPLHRVFHQMPAKERQRAIISPKLNTIRTFRNRIYHYEPISWDFDELEKHYKIIYEVIGWLEPDLIPWTKELDDFTTELDKAKRILGLLE